MIRLSIALSAATLATAPLAAQTAFPAGFETREVQTNGTTLHVRVGGHGPAVVMLHGFGDTGDMWGPLAADLMRTHQVIVPDLRGMGFSARPADGYDKKTQGQDIAGLLDALHVTTADVVAHDIGNMVAYSFTAQNPHRVRRLVLMDAPVPGLGPWEEVKRSPRTWHFRFYGPDEERLVAGRERIYLDRFWNELSADPAQVGEATRQHYARIYAMPGAIHAAFAQFAAFDQDEIDDKALAAKGKLAMPVLAIGGEKSFGTTMQAAAASFAVNVQGVVIPRAGHWLMEEQPALTVRTIHAFIEAR